MLQTLRLGSNRLTGEWHGIASFNACSDFCSNCLRANARKRHTVSIPSHKSVQLIHLGFCGRFSSLIGQLSHVPHSSTKPSGTQILASPLGLHRFLAWSSPFFGGKETRQAGYSSGPSRYGTASETSSLLINSQTRHIRRSTL